MNIAQKLPSTVLIIKDNFSKVANHLLVLVIAGMLITHPVKADDVSFTNISVVDDRFLITWDVFGQRWNAVVTQDAYLGDEIKIIDVSVSTGNEDLNRILPNCYYRGTLTDDFFTPLANTYAYFNLCDNSVPFVGFVSDSNSVYVIERSATAVTGVQMNIDNPNLDTPYQGISPDHGNVNDTISDGLYPRTSHSGLFPSVEIVLEPAYVSKLENEAYVDRIIENLAFANFIYQLNNMKQLNLIAISLLDESIIWSGGSGSVRSNMQDLRQRTAQSTSADMTLFFLGSNVNTTNIWGWAEDGYACDLQRAVAEGRSVNTINIGRSTGYNVDLPSLIQRGWVLAHEVGHLLNGKHIKDDPLMYGRFIYGTALPDYVAGCLAKSYLFESCAYNEKNWKFTDYYSCN